MSLIIIIPSAQRSCLEGGRVYWFHSVRPSVRLASRVRSVAHTVLVGSSSYLCIFSNNCDRCVVCKVVCYISKFEFLTIFYNVYLWLSLVLTLDLMWITSMGNHGTAGLSQNAGVLVVLLCIGRHYVSQFETEHCKLCFAQNCHI